MNRLKLDIQKFASGSIGFSNGNMEGLINWSSSVVGNTPAQKAQNNKSNVSATIYVRRNDGYTTTGNFTGNVNIAGNVYGFNTYAAAGSGWVAVGSASVQIGHNNNGTKTIYIGGTIVGPTETSWEGKSTSGGQNVGLDTIQRMSSINSFDGLPDAQNRTNNVEGDFKVELTRYNDSFTDNLVIQYLDRTNTGDFVTLKTISNYESGDTFSFTNAELETLYASAPNENTVGLKVCLNTYSGQTLIGASSSQSKWVYIFESNPTFSNFDFEDINAATVALTGDETVNVNGYSNIQITIPVADKAIAKKGATMVDYVITGLDEPIPYSSSEDVTATITNCSTGVYDVYARDSRGNTTLVTKLATRTISYEPIYLNLQNSSVVRTDNGTGDGATLTIRGTIWNGDFGDVNNSITSAIYRLKTTDSSGSYMTGTTDITPTINQDGTITFTGNIRSDAADYSWELDDSYDIQIGISDELSTYIINLVLNSGKPNIALHKMGVSIGAPYDETLGGSLQVDGNKYPTIENSYSTSQTDVYSCDAVNDKIAGEVIYTNSNGATSGNNISKAVENYEYLDIIFGRTGYPSTTRVYKGFYTNHIMSYTYKLGDFLRHYTCMLTLSGTSFSESNGWFLNIRGTSNTEAASLTGLNVYKIIGYK